MTKKPAKKPRVTFHVHTLSDLAEVVGTHYCVFDGELTILDGETRVATYAARAWYSISVATKKKSAKATKKKAAV